MKRTIGLFIVMLFIVSSVMPLVISNPEILHRGSFYAKIGIRDREETQLELNGNFRDFRNRHLVFGTVNILDSERTFRFQGIATRNAFILQSAVSNNIVNIIGSFTRYDEETQTFYGQWRGIIAGHGHTNGWIEAHFV